jgi:hypothetical protein
MIFTLPRFRSSRPVHIAGGVRGASRSFAVDHTPSLGHESGQQLRLGSCCASGACGVGNPRKRPLHSGDRHGGHPAVWIEPDFVTWQGQSWGQSHSCKS